MNGYQNILDKLNQFTRRFYSKMLVKGILLFTVLGIIFFFVVLGVEYFLWLGSTGRFTLLVLFIAVELVLFYRYIATPLFYLFQVKKGISNKQASLLIGRHFSEVGDRLYNLLELAEDKERSELLLASIEQRSERLNHVPFVKAIDFRESFKYAKYLIVPLLLFGLVWLTGNLSSFFGSYERVVNYDLAYEPPAPFSFQLLSRDVDVLESESYTILVTTIGEVRPNVVFITIGGKRLLMQSLENGFQYTLTPPLASIDFYFSANGVKSKNYHLNALKIPSIQNFQMVLDYPKYINRASEVLNGTGNATFPEGTSVKWKIVGQNTKAVHLVTKDTVLSFDNTEESFEFSKKIYADLNYQLATSNENIKYYEKLDYSFDVVKDEFPKIRAEQVLDSLNPNVSYYSGEASDDYSLRSIRLVCYPDKDAESKQIVPLTNPNSNFEQFYYTFPSGLQLVDGERYSFYFEATDNDAIHKGKTSKSQVFSLFVLDENQLKNRQLEFQESILDNMDRSLENLREQKEALQDINKEQKEKNSLNFHDQNQVKDFLKKQQQQENLMQKFSKQLKENLENAEKDDDLNEMLKERLERQELEAKKNERLLEELQKIADKIDKEELTKRLEELGKKQQNSERSLEQLLELTKRYYVTEKASQLAKDLEKLAKRQDYLSEIKIGEEFSSKEQKKLNEDFENIATELDELKKDNEALKKPMELNIDKEKEEGVKEDQKDALEQINKHEGIEESSESEEKEKAGKTASQKQKAAAQKMKEMAKQLQQSSSAGGESGITEDAEMLRQILDNLVTFSFKQENLFDTLKEADEDISQFAGSVRKQQELRGLFEHVDDSLFALSLRRAELSEFVNEQITEVYYNMDKALERMAESRMYQGVSYQKYVLNASNSLADFLARILDNMQQSMQMGQGQGQGQDFQLPDIIKGQSELQQKMEQMGQSGEGSPSKGKQGEEGQDGKGEKPGEGNKPGEGQKGKSGQEGQQGEDGQGQKNSENGKSGNGQGQGEGQQGGQGQGPPNEQELQELYEIYKEQQMIRQLLEQQLQDMINKGDQELAKKLLRQMENFENDLIENGVTRRTLNKMNIIQHQLLRLENAALKQGKKKERESTTNRELFQNPITTKPTNLEEYQNEIEILNRQDLPLLQIYRNKVKQYFQKDD